jgi:hypothetical protein
VWFADQSRLPSRADFFKTTLALVALALLFIGYQLGALTWIAQQLIEHR